METDKRQPGKEIRAGTIAAFIREERGADNEKSHATVSIRIQKRYRDEKPGRWKTTTHVCPDELPKRSLVATGACDHLMLHQTDALAGQ